MIVNDQADTADAGGCIVKVRVAKLAEKLASGSSGRRQWLPTRHPGTSIAAAVVARIVRVERCLPLSAAFANDGLPANDFLLTPTFV